VFLEKGRGAHYVRQHETERLAQALMQLLIDLGAEPHQFFYGVLFCHCLSSAAAGSLQGALGTERSTASPASAYRGWAAHTSPSLPLYRHFLTDCLGTPGDVQMMLGRVDGPAHGVAARN
jgi:hypothetical protein